MNQSKATYIASMVQAFLDSENVACLDIILTNFLSQSDKKLVETFHTHFGNKKLDDKYFYFFDEVAKQVSEENKKKYANFFTPYDIAKKMAVEMLEGIQMESAKLIDPAVGGGVLIAAFLNQLVEIDASIDLTSYVESNLYGIDILSENIETTVIVLRLILALNRQRPLKGHHLIQGDTLRIMDEYPEFEANFDLIIANPPYMSSLDLSDEDKKYMRTVWTRSSFGSLDLYLAFFEIGEWLIKPQGIMEYITPNSFLSSENGRKVRAMMREKATSITIHNFGNGKLFGKSVMSYSAISKVAYDKYRDDALVKTYANYDFINHEMFDVSLDTSAQTSWPNITKETVSILDKINEADGIMLKSLPFKNGVATQRNNIYAFEVTKQTDYDVSFRDIVSGKIITIEKDITRGFVLPNNWSKNNQRIIFPYIQNGEKTNIISEVDFKMRFPKAYDYLNSHKDELDKRKSDGNEWYAYGRSQGINFRGKRIYIPYMGYKLDTRISTNVDEIFAAGYAIFHENVEYLKVIQMLLNSKLFSYYLTMVAKPYSGDYYSTAKSQIGEFVIPTEDTGFMDLESILRKFYRLSNNEISMINLEIND